MMLDFYGIRIKDRETGVLERNDHWKVSYQYLNNHKHCCTIITRILKCLGEFDLQNYQTNLVKHFIAEISVHHELGNCATACTVFWIATVRDDSTRLELEKKIHSKKTQHHSNLSQSHSHPQSHHNRLASSRVTEDDDDDSESDVDADVVFSPSDRDEMLRDDDLGEYTKLSVEEEDTDGSRKEDDMGDREDE